MNHSTLHAPVTLSASSDAAGGGASRPTPARLRRSASPLHHVAHVERAPVRRLLGQLLDQLSSQELSHVTHRPSDLVAGPVAFLRAAANQDVTTGFLHTHRRPPERGPGAYALDCPRPRPCLRGRGTPRRRCAGRGGWPRSCHRGGRVRKLPPWSTSPKTPAAAAVTVQPSLLPSAASRRTVCGAGASTTQGPRHVARTTGSRSARTLHRFL